MAVCNVSPHVKLPLEQLSVKALPSTGPGGLFPPQPGLEAKVSPGGLWVIVTRTGMIGNPVSPPQKITWEGRRGGKVQ